MPLPVQAKYVALPCLVHCTCAYSPGLGHDDAAMSDADAMPPRLVTLEDWIVDATCWTASVEDASQDMVSTRKRAIALEQTDRARAFE